MISPLSWIFALTSRRTKCDLTGRVSNSREQGGSPEWYFKQERSRESERAKGIGGSLVR
jgi:hypothetical protein